MTMKWRKSPEALVKKFDSMIPDDPRVERRKMFGYPAAFAGGHLFMSLFEDSLVLRLADEDRTAFLKLEGTSHFEPMPGRAMREYVTAPPPLLARPKSLAPWIRRSLDYARSMPPKAATRRPPARGAGGGAGRRTAR